MTANAVATAREVYDPRVLPRLHPPLWMEDAACGQIGPDLFFNPDSIKTHFTEARLICQRCPVTAACIQWGLQVDRDGGGYRYGVYGGLTPDQRAALDRQANAA